MNPWDWLRQAVTKEFVVLDVENRFWQNRLKNDMPDFDDGRNYKREQEAFEKERGSGKQSDGEVKYEYQLNMELRSHIDRWRDYCYAIGFIAPGLPALVWSEMDGTPLSRQDMGSFLAYLVSRVPIVAHNSAHDVRIIKNNWGIPIEHYKRIDDSMLLHNVLWSELRHTLNFCSGVYSTQNMHKDLGTHSRVYLHGDVRTTAEVWWNLKKEADKDPKSWNIYETLQRPMLPILLESHLHGVRLNVPFLLKTKESLSQKRLGAMEVANSYVQQFSKPSKLSKKLLKPEDGEAYTEAIEGGQIDPDPTRIVNMNSSVQMNKWVYDNCELKIKGLRRSKKGQKLYPLGKDQVAVLQDQYYPRDEEEDTFESRLAMGGHPLIEAKAEFTTADKYLSSYILPFLESERMHPQFKLHGQATGRWSTTDPNLPGMNKSLKPLLIPDVGHCWVGGDWSNAELRIMGELSGDELLVRGFKEGWDLHSMHVSQAFGWDSPIGRHAWALQFRKIKGTWKEFADGKEFPRGKGWWGRIGPTEWKDVKVPVDFPWDQWIIEGGPQPGWMAGDDLFRRFAKVLVFRLMYGGGVESAAQIPGAKSMGLPEKRLVQASKDLILAHPWWEEFWKDVGGTARTEKIVRNPNGRARRLMSTRADNRFREGVNFPIQSWVSDLLNGTLLRIKERAPYAVMIKTCHDSFDFQCPLDKREELGYIIREEAIRPLRGDFFIPFDCESTTYDEDTGVRTVSEWKDNEWKFASAA